MILVESTEKIVDLLSIAGTIFPKAPRGVLKCSPILSVQIFFIPFFNCVLSDWLKYLSAQCLLL